MVEQKLVNEDKQTKVRFVEKLGFGGFALSNNVVYQFKGTYFLFFLTNVLGLQPIMAGLIITLGTIWDAVNDPLLGYIAINHRFKSGEMSRPFALWYALPVAAMLVLSFTVIDASTTVKFIWSLACYILYDTLLTLDNIPYNTMPTLATSHDPDRVSISLFVTGGGGIGVAIGAIAVFPLVRLFGGLDNTGRLVDGRGFTWAALVLAALFAAGSLFHYATSRERVKPMHDAAGKIGFIAAIRMLIRCDSWVKNMLFNVLYMMSNIFITSSLVYYTTYVLGKPSAVTPILACYIAGSLLSIPFVGPFHRRFGRRATMMAGALAYIAGKVWFIIDPLSTLAIMLNATLIGVGATFCFSMLITNRADTVDLIEWADGRRIDSLVGTTMTFAGKCASALCSFLIGILLQLSRYDATLTVQPDSAITAINSLLGWIPLALGLILLLVSATMKIEDEVRAMNEGKKAQGMLQGMPPILPR